MKVNKNIKIGLVVLLCILIILIGFFGIYTKSGNSYKNLLPNYTLASDLKGAMVLELEVSDATNSTYYDENGNKVDSSKITDENKSNYKEEKVAVNPEENLNKENYDKTVKIMKDRLSFLKADQYQINQDKNTGKINLILEDDYIEDIESLLPLEGKLNLVDSNTEDVILDYSDFKSVEASYASLDEGNTTYISLKLNNSGIEKINNIDKYKTNEQKDEEGNLVENKLKLIFDSETISEVKYDDILLTGKTLRITTGENLKSNSEIQSKMNTGSVVAKLATIGKMPVVYKINTVEYINTNNINFVKYLIIIFIVASMIIALYAIIKYKVIGMAFALTYVTNIAIILILVRITKVPLSLNSFAGFLIILFINTMLGKNILKALKEENKEFSEIVKMGYLKTIDILIASIIVLVAFSFTNMKVISSMGLLVFWGWLITVLGNLIFMVPLLANINKK